jgi:hypothetical protein
MQLAVSNGIPVAKSGNKNVALIPVIGPLTRGRTSDAALSGAASGLALALDRFELNARRVFGGKLVSRRLHYISQFDLGSFRARHLKNPFVIKFG